MRFLALMTLTAFVIAACGSDDAEEETDPTIPEGTDGGVILEISEGGGLVPIEFNLTRVPRFTVFSDGSVVMPEDRQFGFPGPALVPVVQSTLDQATMSDLLTFVGDLGLAEVESVELNNAPNVADAPTTVVRYFDDTGEHRMSIYALGITSPQDARAAIVASMIAMLDNRTRDLSTNPYPIDRLVVYALRADGLDQQQTRNAGPWPLEFAPEDMGGRAESFRCATVEGNVATRLAETLADADSMTTWTHDVDELRIIARPLLPHQDGC